MPENVADSAPDRALSEVEERRLTARARRLAREAETRRQAADGRTRIGRRQRAVEAELRRELLRLGRAITTHDSITIGYLAGLLVQAELARAAQSRGAHIDLEQLTRIANCAQRAIAALGLQPVKLEPPSDSSLPRFGT